MSRRNLLNLGLLGLVIALLALAIFEPGRDRQPAPVPLFTLKPEQVDTIRIKRPEHEDLALQRRQGNWFIIKPLEAPANASLVDRVLKITTSTCPVRYAAAELELARLQLDPPRLRLILNDQALAFGGTETLNGRRYVQIGDSVYLCSDRFYYLLTGTLENFTTPRTPAETTR